MKHDDLTAELLAEVWHRVAEYISIAAAISGIGIAVTATVGTFWHRWAIRQHQLEINRIRKEATSPTIEPL